jgi:hypothetical protein
MGTEHHGNYGVSQSYVYDLSVSCQLPCFPPLSSISFASCLTSLTCWWPNRLQSLPLCSYLKAHSGSKNINCTLTYALNMVANYSGVVSQPCTACWCLSVWVMSSLDEYISPPYVWYVSLCETFNTGSRTVLSLSVHYHITTADVKEYVNVHKLTFLKYIHLLCTFI